MDKLPRIPSPPGTAFREFRIAVLPFVVFAAVLGLTVFTWSNYVGPSNFVGEVESARAIVTSAQAGHITVLSVDTLDRVVAGQPLVQIIPADPRAIGTQIGISRARLTFLRDGLDARLRQQNNRISFLQLRLDWLSQRAELAALRAQQAYFRSELERQEQLAAANTATSRITSVSEYQVAKRDYDSLTAEIDERASLVAELEQSMNRIRPEEDQLKDEVPAALRTALALEERELGQLERQLGPIILSAPSDGVVAVIHRRVGENILAGEPILTLSATRSDRVVAYVRQPLTLNIRTNMTIEVRSRAHHHDSGLGRVLAVGSQMEPILPQLLPRSAGAGGGSNAIEYGLPILVSLPPELRVIPGEIVDLNPTTD